MASRLEVNSWRRAPGFLLASLRLWWQARRSPGVLGLTLKAEMVKGVFWTYSVWEDKAAIYAYAGSEPHKSTVARKRKVMRDATFVFFTAPADESRLSWDEVGRRLTAQRDSATSDPTA
ncbi:antibiotic biosynthesis monooxygenase [Nocardia acidivorans]|uniref:antibiotic biosynthesis monooxygenase n=1 Tax=Nocardia acidivorans TaxID=404580 RepID=UPI0009FF6A7D|nr:antibiotic biosynthesis monooxygenase [Nocardia acidivorans]